MSTYKGTFYGKEFAVDIPDIPKEYVEFAKHFNLSISVVCQTYPGCQHLLYLGLVHGTEQSRITLDHLHDMIASEAYTPKEVAMIQAFLPVYDACRLQGTLLAPMQSISRKLATLYARAQRKLFPDVKIVRVTR